MALILKDSTSSLYRLKTKQKKKRKKEKKLPDFKKRVKVEEDLDYSFKNSMVLFNFGPSLF